MNTNVHFIFLMILGAFICDTIIAQTATSWSDVINEEKGDTVVVMGYESSGFLNTLLTAVKGDTAADGSRTNPNRIYETIPGETYISDVTLELDTIVPLLHITAPEPPAGVMPPLHIRANKQDGTFDKTLFQLPGSTKMENQYFLLAIISDNYALDREFMRCQGISSRHEYHNCVFELVVFCLFWSRAHHQTFKFTNCTFINLGHTPSLIYGRLSNLNFPVDTLWFENNTILIHGSLSAGWIDFNVAPNFCYLNHNTIVNGIQNPFQFYSQPEMIVTNNLIINTGIAPEFTGSLVFCQDDDLLPKGIINVDTVEQAWIDDLWPDSMYPYAEADRKILVDRNNAWWDPRFTDMFDSLPESDPCLKDKQLLDQKIRMNTRTQAMFDDDDSYPYFNEGIWYNIEPDFINNKDLVDELSSFIINNTPVHMCFYSGGAYMPWWRTNWHWDSTTTEPDWPPLADLSYTNPTLRSGGLGGFPLGDLNWFPEQKKTWEGTHESDTLLKALKTGTLPVGISKNRTAGELKFSVFPNPLTNSATLKYNITSGTNVEINLYNLFGERVRVIALGYQRAGNNTIIIDRGGLTPGIYILQINTGNNKTRVNAKIVVK